MRKTILLFLSIVCICCTILALTACNNDSNNQGQVSTHEHKYEEKVTLPTCTEKGFTTYTCECGDSYIDNFVDKITHTEEWVVDVEATCTSAGSKHKECSKCKTILAIEVVKALGHTEVVDKEVAATCTASGLTEGKHCSICNEVLVKQELVDKLPHTTSEWIVDAEATCTVAGSKHKECSICKDVLETEGVPALGHDYSDSTCLRCGENFGLTYTLNEDGQSYAVTAIGAFTGSDLVILSKYNNLPVTFIDDGAFSGSVGLTRITIPNSVTAIGGYAFRYCTTLTKVYYIGTAEEWNKITIGYGNDLLTKATRYYYTENEPTTDGNYWRYDEKGNIIEVPYTQSKPQPVREIWMDFSQLGNFYKGMEINQEVEIFTITNGKGKITAGKTAREGSKAGTVFTGGVQLGKNGSATDKCITFTVPEGMTTLELYVYCPSSNVYGTFNVSVNGTVTSYPLVEYNITCVTVTVKEGDTITIYSSADNLTNVYGILIK